MNERQLQANVLRGVRLLDKKDSAWWNGGGKSKAVIDGMVGHIDLEMLDLTSAACCVLGQRSATYYAGGLLALRIDEEVAHLYGFNTKDADGYTDRAEYSTLTELWASVIQSRRYPRRKIAKDPFVLRANKTWQREAR